MEWFVNCRKCQKPCRLTSQLVYDIVKNSDRFFCSGCVDRRYKRPKEIATVSTDTICVINTEKPNWNPSERCFSRICPKCNRVINHRGRQAVGNCRVGIRTKKTCLHCRDEGNKWSKERRAAFSKRMSGKNNPMFGYKFTPEQRQRMSMTRRGQLNGNYRGGIWLEATHSINFPTILI